MGSGLCNTQYKSDGMLFVSWSPSTTYSKENRHDFAVDSDVLAIVGNSMRPVGTGRSLALSLLNFAPHLLQGARQKRPGAAVCCCRSKKANANLLLVASKIF